MPNTRIVIPSLFGGVSRQPDSVRHENQVKEADNVYLTVRSGATRRPGTRWITRLATGTESTRLHAIDRDGSERYLIAYSDGGQLHATTLSGDQVPIYADDDAAAYLAENDPTADQLRLVTLSDYTLIANTTVPTGWLDADAFVVTSEFNDYDVMASSTPAASTYHRTRADTITKTAGYWQYKPGSGTFATFKGKTVSGSYATPATYSADSRNPGGFKITWKKPDGTDETFEIRVDMQRATLNDMHDVAAEFQKALRNAGAANACIGWEYTGATAGFFTITSPYHGTVASWPTTPTDSPTSGFDYSSDDLPFSRFSGDFTKTDGTGDSDTPVPAVEDRWVRVPAPGQRKAKLDPATMPMQMVLKTNPPEATLTYEQDVTALGPVVHFRFESIIGSVVTNNAGPSGSMTGTDGVDWYTIGDGTLPDGLQLTMVDRVLVLTNTGAGHVNLPASGGFPAMGGTLDTNGCTIEFLLKTTQTTAAAILSAVGGSTELEIDLNNPSSGTLFVFLSDGSQVLQAQVYDTALNDGAWHHVAIRIDTPNKVVTVQIDGQRKAIDYVQRGAIASTSNFTSGRLGKYRTGSSMALTGRLEEFVIYPTLISLDRLKGHYDKIVWDARAFTPLYFDLTTVDWKFRETGDEDSNPLPEIVAKNKPISDITFHRNRLVLTGDDIVTMSQAGDVFNFFAADADNIGDADPIEAPVNTNQITLIDAVVPFQKSLAIFTKAPQQFELNAPETLTQNTAAITATTSYQSMVGVRPVSIGNRLYFAAKLQGTTQLYEYFYDDSAASTDAADVSAHAQGYLPDDVRRLVAVPNTGSVLLLPTNGTTVYQYASFWGGDKKVQSAWSKLSFPGLTSIEDIAVIGNDCYVLARSSLTGSSPMLLRLALSDEDIDAGMPFQPRLDTLYTATGTYNAGTNRTTWNIPSGYSPDAVVQGASHATPGDEIAIATLSTSGPYTVTAIGDWTDGPVYLGRKFTSRLTLSRPFQRDQNGAALLDTEITIDKLVTHHQNTAAYSVQIEQPLRPTRTIPFTPREDEVEPLGEFQSFVMGNAKTTTITIQESSVKPFTISALEYIATVTPRSQ